MKHRSLIVSCLLILIISLGAFLHYVNVTPYYIYPDSYQNILIAENIRNYHSVVGTLGKNGQVWPDYVGWTRPGYSLLILLGTIFFKDYFISAKIITFLASVIAIPLAYALLRKVYPGRRTALCGALLIAISANYVIWGGIILTEGVSVMITLLALWQFFQTIKKESVLADTQDLIVGFALGVAVLIRYEYAILIATCLASILIVSPKPWVKITNILTSIIFILSITAAQIFPISETFARLNSQNKTLQWLAVALIVGLTGSALFLPKLKKFQKIIQWLSASAIGTATLLSFFIIIQLVYPQFSFLRFQLSAPRNFFAIDILLGITTLIGMWRLHFHEKRYALILFSTINIVMLALFYYQVNELMQRYWTHLIPFLLIPASYGLNYLVKLTQYEKVPKYLYKRLMTVDWYSHHSFKSKTAVALTSIFLLFIGYQIGVTLQGFQLWGNGEYFITSYSQEAASKIKKYTKPTDILIVSFPESYFAHTQLSTHSLADKPPYIYISDTLNDKEIIIVEDMAMREFFPKFSAILEQKLQRNKIGEECTSRNYHYAQRSEKETQPIKIYRTTLGSLKQALR